jgi:hypothetical protein
LVFFLFPSPHLIPSTTSFHIHKTLLNMRLIVQFTLELILGLDLNSIFRRKIKNKKNSKFKIQNSPQHTNKTPNPSTHPPPPPENVRI